MRLAHVCRFENIKYARAASATSFEQKEVHCRSDETMDVVDAVDVDAASDDRETNTRIGYN